MTNQVLLREEALSLKLPTVEVAVGDNIFEIEYLSAGDVDFLRSILSDPPVDFAISLLAHQARGDPSREALGALPRPTLLRICRTWSSHSNTLDADPHSIQRFEDVRELAAEKVKEWDRDTREVVERLAQALPRFRVELPEAFRREIRKIQLVSHQISALASSLTEITDRVVSTVQSAMPDVQGLANALAEADDGKTHLDDHGYGFATMDWSIGPLRRIGRERPTSRATHRAFLTYTREQSFGSRLLERVRSSGILSRRALIIESAFESHVRRDYALSVPALYAQLEGILTDLLVIEGLARRSGGTARKAGTGGKLHGLHAKAKQYGKGASAVRRFITQEILEELTPERNAVLHGSKTGYRQASRSVQLLLFIDTLTKIVVRLEGQSTQN